ncbi:MAG: HigA family addiction module antidote protein [Rhodospirillaceae bacterium]|jgi:antitoxin HigA-1|nr:HigA family addiction module antidote protein [Rhodospirillaceae bacterium]
MTYLTHPGKILKGELQARAITGTELARRIKVPANRIGDILRGRRGITGDTALRLGIYLGTGPEVWMNLQSQYDLTKAEAEHGETIAREVKAA